jgi:glycerol-3-phosphate dehydrogenase subunit B
MFERVAVVGAGAAGLAAAWAAAERGAELRVFDAGVGASCLGGGAVDDRPWEEVARAAALLGVEPVAAALGERVLAFAEALGLWRLVAPGRSLVWLATESGYVRPARGADLALLDLAVLPAGARLVLPRVPRPEWDADALARTLADDPWSRARGMRFDVIDAVALRFAGEERIAAGELAARHDDPQRLGWLGDRLAEALGRAGRADAVLCGAWLGADAPRAASLAARLGTPVGEILAGVGSAAGLRFEAARRALLARMGVALEKREVVTVDPDAGEVRVELAGEGERATIADAVVLAAGGLGAGGVVYDPPEAAAGRGFPGSGRCAFRVAFAAPVQMRAHGRRLERVGSVHGPALDEVAWPTDADPGLLEAVGVAVDDDGVRCGPDLYAAGDLVADAPRTLLRAVESGLRAGAAAGGEPGE